MVEPELYRFPAATPLPLILYRAALGQVGKDGQPDRTKGAAAACEALFARHGWGGAWQDGIYHYHHYHATQHEVLGIVAGQAFVRFGGEDGNLVEVKAGDVVVIPAGVSHCNEGSSQDLLVVGAYPGGASPDLQRGAPEAPGARRPSAPLPAADPVYGPRGPLMQSWKRGSAAEPREAPASDAVQG
jgi:uncharacterized protein YjlB